MSPGFWPTVNVDPPEPPPSWCAACGQRDDEDYCQCSQTVCGRCGGVLGRSWFGCRCEAS